MGHRSTFINKFFDCVSSKSTSSKRIYEFSNVFLMKKLHFFNKNFSHIVSNKSTLIFFKTIQTGTKFHI